MGQCGDYVRINSDICTRKTQTPPPERLKYTENPT